MPQDDTKTTETEPQFRATDSQYQPLGRAQADYQPVERRVHQQTRGLPFQSVRQAKALEGESQLRALVTRGHALENRIRSCADRASDLIARIYGEGDMAVQKAPGGPKALGLSAEITEIMAALEDEAERLEGKMARLDQFA